MVAGTYAERPDGFLLAPGDVRGTRLVPERSGNSCWGVVPGEEPNLVCEGCGADVGERTDDCDAWQTTVLLRRAVRRNDEPTEDEPWENPDESLGRFPVDHEGRADWLWFGRLSLGADDLLARSDGLPLYFSPDTEPIRDFMLGLFGDTPEAARLRVPPVRDREPIAVCDLDGPDRPFALPEFARGADVLELRIVPDDDPELPMPLVPVHEHVWRYLAYGRHQAVRPGWWDDEPPARLAAGVAFSEGAWLRPRRRWRR